MRPRKYFPGDISSVMLVSSQSQLDLQFHMITIICFKNSKDFTLVVYNFKWWMASIESLRHSQNFSLDYDNQVSIIFTSPQILSSSKSPQQEDNLWKHEKCYSPEFQNPFIIPPKSQSDLSQQHSTPRPISVLVRISRFVI